MLDQTEPIEPDEPFVISVEEACKIIGISRRTAGTLIAEGDFPSFKIRDRRFVDPKDLKEWINQKKKDSLYFKKNAKRRGESAGK